MRYALATLFATAAFAQTASKTPPAPTVARVFDGPVRTVESEMVPLVEAMPADKFGFAPSNGEFKGVRTFAQQAKHVAATNYMMAAAAQGQKPPVDTGGEAGPESIKTKEQIVQFLKDSFAYAHKAAQALTETNMLEMVKSPFGPNQTPRGGVVNSIAWHAFDHYGQMVVYLRMNGIVPPASR